MKNGFTWLVTLWGIATSAFAQKPIEVLYITGHTDRYHSWETMSGYQLTLLEESGLFRVDTLVLPATVTEEPANFSAYDVVILNINDVQWPTTWKRLSSTVTAISSPPVITNCAITCIRRLERYCMADFISIRTE